MAQCCWWCKMGFLGRGSTDQHGRVFCTPDHRAQYLIMNPSRCDNCNGVIHTSRLDTKAERFCSTSIRQGASDYRAEGAPAAQQH